ncbi:hypothetical protein GQ53DRAFT_817565 [Thozetella sp. PMI_491]|nr:hypothetical protein GQ53DRAFT_817565 [Thozetella sp. PMI_491]
MGLALLDPSDSSYLCNLSEHRHLPGRKANPGEKHPRRPFHWSREKLSKIDFKYEEAHDTLLWRQIQATLAEDGIPSDIEELLREDWPPQLRKKHHLAALAFQASRGRRNKYREYGSLDARMQGRSGGSRLEWMVDEVEEGRALARSPLRLPGDRARERRPPSLERQEAFREPSSSRKRSFSGMADLLDEAELYRLGVLYDDEQERGAGFDFDAILRDEPQFSVRPAKRGRGRKGKPCASSLEHAPCLPLHLSFSTLRDDEALAAFLISPEASELAREESPSASPSRASERRAASSQPALTTIYELEIEHSHDFLSQPNPALSFDDHAATAAFAVPDLLSDSEYDENDGDDDEGAWALLDRLNDDDEDMHEESESDGASDGGALSPSNADAWIMLGDDSKQVRT